MALIVYGANLSPFVRKVRIAMAEKGLDYALEPVNPFSPPPEFSKISPLKRIPVLRDTSVTEPNTLADSSVICDYLDHLKPSPPLYPADKFERARALWFEEYADSLMAQCIGSGLFFERVVKKMMRQTTDEDTCQKTLNERLPPVFDYLQKEIGTKQFLAGNMFSVADISVGTMFVNFHHAGEVLDGRWDKLSDYVSRVHARASFKSCIDEETPLISRMRAA